MKKAQSFIFANKHLSFSCLVLLLFSCRQNVGQWDNHAINANKAAVTALALHIEKDITRHGPAAWLNYFEDSPEFFMASGGNLVFKDYVSAKTFILNTLVKTLPQIKLEWDHIRVSSISTQWAGIGAGFHEELTDSLGKTVIVNGYFTGTAHKTTSGWKLRDAHWSIKPAAI